MSKKSDSLIDGFTLIELLVVVAILAILAGIATINFLEAQTRAKVSRTKADLRSVGIALEMSNVDVGHYPSSVAPEVIGNLSPLISPIAYISSLPDDVFANNLKDSYAPFDWSIIYKSNGRLVRPYTFDYLNFRGNVPYDHYEYLTNGRSGIEWALRGIGPDQEPVWLKYEMLVQYDPSNGTVSKGVILYMGPGG